MSDLSDVKGVMIIGAHLAEAAISRTVNLVVSSMITVPRDMTAYTYLDNLIIDKELRGFISYHKHSFEKLCSARQAHGSR
ncbi:hypothetical protein TNCV_1668901 [Trichonephila clavipes]|nr:hypothetical protein TNCV_1668901 [Trichonephila clavipes]